MTAGDLVYLKREDCDRVAAAINRAISTIQNLDPRSREPTRDALERLHVAWAVMVAARPFPTPAPEGEPKP